MVQTSHFARGLKVRGRILNKKCKIGQNGVWPRSSATSRSRGLLLNKEATTALRNGKSTTHNKKYVLWNVYLPNGVHFVCLNRLSCTEVGIYNGANSPNGF